MWHASWVMTGSRREYVSSGVKQRDHEGCLAGIDGQGVTLPYAMTNETRSGWPQMQRFRGGTLQEDVRMIVYHLA